MDFLERVGSRFRTSTIDITFPNFILSLHTSNYVQENMFVIEAIITRGSIKLGLFRYSWGYTNRLYSPCSVLSHSTVPKVACLGERVALFKKPFEARPSDPLRKEVFRQQAAHRSHWFAPSTIPSGVPAGTTPALQTSVGPVPGPRGKRRRR